MHDFTLLKYCQLCSALRQGKYQTVPVRQYLERDWAGTNVAIIRHDIDRRPEKALLLAELEADHGIQATYYFRYPDTFVPPIVSVIAANHHEIGYHYEVLAKAKGDYSAAIRLFEKELNEFRRHWEIKTICSHGSVLSRYNNLDLWSRYRFSDFDILGEAYLSFQNIRYLSDTGRTWGPGNKIRDSIPSHHEEIHLHTTDDLIHWIRESSEPVLYLNIHPERWAVNSFDYVRCLTADSIRTIAKKVIRLGRNNRS
jgi:hypothetical protein